MMSTTAFRNTMKKAANMVVARTGRHVELSYRLGRVLPHALEIEHRLREDRAAADDRSEVEPPERDYRNHRVAQHVAHHDLALRQALGARSAHVVLVDGVEHVRTQDTRVEADEQDGQRGPGEDQVVGPVDRVFRQLHVAAVGEHSPFEAQVVVHQSPDPEHGDRDAHQREDGEEPVGELARPDCAVETEGRRPRTSTGCAAPMARDNVRGRPFLISSPTGSCVT